MMKPSSQYLTFLMIMIMLIIMFYFMMMNLHPILMVILLVLYSMLTCLITSKWTHNIIYSIMLFLIMISGLLIIFLYFSSLISNEQNTFKFNPLIMINYIMNLLFMFLYYLMNYTPYTMIMYPFMENTQMTNLNMNLFQNITYIYSYPFNNLTLICMFYLLLTLLMIIKICSIKNSSLRKLK